ncbi:hypothetical protein F4776DRAFT_62354 [Hypoxylon sp. NC0597]|nr:hypothetical protein F4776DRAFT_62354 [Hypoxylon sp. NC0597]
MKPHFWAVATTALISAILAQTLTSGDNESTVTATGSSAAATYTVMVGLQHDFQPDTIQANPGDTIRFNFYPKNHSVVRADFKKPCIPWELTQDPTESFFSGPVEQDTLQSPIPSWDLKVNNTDPVFFYCSAPDSCIKWKMVGVINPNKTFTLDIQKAFVDNSTFQLSPGEDFPDESSPSITTTSDSAPTSTSTSTATDSTNPGSNSGGGRLSGGAIAGIAIGGAAVVAIIAALIYLCGRKGGIEKGYRRSTVAGGAPPPMMEATYNDNGPKSPPMNSPYGMYADPYRSPSPTAWSSQMGSPHASYLGQPSPGFPPYSTGSPHIPGQDQQQYFEAPDSQRYPPAELPATPGHTAPR